jgi:exodeoxyribonuclease VII small subunit
MPKSKKTTDDPPLKYEQAIEQLEDLIDAIESGEVGLEESLAQYEKGTKLIQHCRDILNTAEKRIAELTEDDEGGLEVEES